MIAHNDSIVVSPNVTGRPWARYLCPLCGDGHPRDASHRSLAVGSRGKVICHRCGFETWVNAPTTAIPCTSISSENENELRQKTAAARDLWTSSVSLMSDAAAPARSYLERERGLDAQALHALDVAFVYRWPWPLVGPTIAFAMRDQRGDLVALQGRSTTPNVVCKHPAIGAKKLGVYSTTSALDTRPIGLCESPLDACSLHVAGLDAIACGGTSFPRWLPGALLMNHSVIVATDADDAGDRFARELRNSLLRAGIEPRRIVRLRPSRSKDANAELVADPARFRADVRCAIGDQE